MKPGPFARRKCPKAAGKFTQSGFGVCLHKRGRLINKTHGGGQSMCLILATHLSAILAALESPGVYQSPSTGCPLPGTARPKLGMESDNLHHSLTPEPRASTQARAGKTGPKVHDIVKPYFNQTPCPSALQILQVPPAFVTASSRDIKGTSKICPGKSLLKPCSQDAPAPTWLTPRSMAGPEAFSICLRAAGGMML